MRDWITGLLAVLGALLVLAAATITTITSLTSKPSDNTTTPANAGSWWARLHGLHGPERLLVWGVALLVLAAITAGAISINLGANAGSH